MMSFSEIAEIIWKVTASERSIHCHKSSCCPTFHAPYGHDDPEGKRISEECVRVGCLDLVHELWEYLETKLEKESVRRSLEQASNPSAYVWQMVATHLKDRRRQDRVRRGFPARPSRTDGSAGRVVKALEAQGGARGDWLVRLFRILRSYPFGPRYVAGYWPITGLIQEYAATGDGAIDESQVLSDINEVLGVAKETLGPAWVHDNLTLPALCNGPTAELCDADHAVDGPSVDRVLSTMLLAAYQRRQQPEKSSDIALREAIKEVCGVDVRITQELRNALDEFGQSE